MTSIILPNLNTDVRFLRPRIQSILSQIYADWECIVIDGHSQNSSWEFLRDELKHDSRFRLYQKPRLGIYNAWNEGIKLAKGEYIYIATSDDTMHTDFLQKMVLALEQFQSCDMAHCCLEIIDENGSTVTEKNWNTFLSSQFFGDTMLQKHIRYAPHDGILHAFIKTVYHSITQLLVRKKVFDDLGLFLENSGSIADFEWGMRVSLFKNTIHLPEYLATWRRHENQATRSDIQTNPRTYGKLIKWVSLNLKLFKERSSSDFKEITINELTEVYRQNERYFFLQRLKERNILMYRFYRKVFRKSLPFSNGVEEAQQYFKKSKLSQLLEVLPPT